MMKVGLGSGWVANSGDAQAAQPRTTGFIPPGPAELAQRFPQLEICEMIGRGGMGAVYRARQKQLNRFVALKILPTEVSESPAFAERFTREAQALAKLNHPGIVTLYEFGQADGLFYFLMEFVDGVNLRHLLEAGRLSPREALAIVPRICDALQYAHDQGIVHRDIKPENILLDRQGRVKVADFGLAKLVGTQAEPAADPGTTSGSVVLTEAGEVMGTPRYMAPEQAEAPTTVDHRADIYSLGVVLYQMLTGELPEERIEPPSRKVQVDVRLDEVVLRALEKEPSRRYQQASQVRNDIETITGFAGEELAPGKTFKMAGIERLPPEVLAVRNHLNRASLAVFLLGLVGVVSVIYYAVISYALPRDIQLLVAQLLRFVGIGSQFLSWPANLNLIRHLTSTLAFVSAWQLRRGRGFHLAHAAIFLSVLQSPLLPLAGLLAVYALAILWRREVRAAFPVSKGAAGARVGEDAEAKTARHLALTSAALVLVSFLCLPIFLLGGHDVGFQPGLRSLVFWPLRYLPHWTQGAGLVLGWLALLEARRVRGSASGMGWAVFGVTFPPLCWIASRFARQEECECYAVNPTAFEPSLELNLAILTVACLLATLIAAGWHWRLISLARCGKQEAAVKWVQRMFWCAGIGVAGYATALTFRWQSWRTPSRSLMLLLVALAGGLAGWLIHCRRVRAQVKAGDELWRLAKWSSWALGAALAVFAACSMLPYEYRRVFEDHVNLYLGFRSQEYLFKYPHEHSPVPDGHDLREFRVHSAIGDIELTAITEPLSTGLTCWLPDGTPLCGGTPALSRLGSGSQGNRELLFCLKVARTNEGTEADSPTRFASRGLRYECIVKTPRDEKACQVSINHWRTPLKGVLFRIPANGQSARLRVGFPAGSWMATDAAWACTVDRRTWNKQSIRCAGSDWTFSHSLLEESRDGLDVSWAGPIRRDAEARLLAVDREGRLHEELEDRGGGVDIGYLSKLVNHTVWGVSQFPGLTLEQLNELRIQIRTFHWIEFQQVSLQPGRRTKVTTVPAGKAHEGVAN